MTTQRGGIILTTVVLIFIVSTLAAAATTVLLWRDGSNAVSQFLSSFGSGSAGDDTTNTPQPTTDLLEPSFTVASELKGDTSELQRQLRDPLRAYYATKSERLGDVRVEPAAADDHTARVTFEVTEEGSTTSHSFFYDRGGNERQGPYPRWEPGMLDAQ